ncbi:hypothetical protein GX51_04376 [Blastomyces parvus]|uniref:Antigenic thaumatin-like protein n=1 Tax=Blastomyces parvus TaxID=2060905 RepID=A0A2B7X253_9EURO|nr:hypothetical protein GX51_04376 [Blastomyces parvus]
MHTQTFVAAVAAFATLVPSVLAGNAIVRNNCPFPVYLQSVGNTGNVPEHTIQSGGVFQEQYRENPNGGGISLKISNKPSGAQITQFEYTLAGPKVFYDVSNINGYPFVDYGLSLASTTHAGCPAINCPPGVKLCHDAYNKPDDNHATKACASASDLTMTLCISGKSRRHQRDFAN